MRKIATFVACVIAAAAAHAETKRFLTLEDAAVAQAKKWQQTGAAKPIMSDDGRVLYPFGQYLPQLTCTLLRACDIALEPGELVTDKPKAGDTSRFLISKAKSGSGDKEVTHIVVKPTDTGIETNLIIYTDRRMYQIKLTSAANEKDYVNAIGFYYPEEIAEQWDESAKLQARTKKQEEKLAEAKAPAACAEKLDFAYRIEGNAPFKPLHVYNACGKVYIHLPEGVARSVAPMLIGVGKDGSAEYINFRAKTSTILEADKLFDKAVLVSGSDDDAARVTITWTKNESKSWFSWNDAGAN
jgi:P-type conjugative transfer protein TrbG